MTRAVNAWAIWHPVYGLQLGTIYTDRRGAWAMRCMNLLHNGQEEVASVAHMEIMGFRAIQVRIKYDEPEAKE